MRAINYRVIQLLFVGILPLLSCLRESPRPIQEGAIDKIVFYVPPWVLKTQYVAPPSLFLQRKEEFIGIGYSRTIFQFEFSDEETITKVSSIADSWRTTLPPKSTVILAVCAVHIKEENAKKRSVKYATFFAEDTTFTFEGKYYSDEGIFFKYLSSESMKRGDSAAVNYEKVRKDSLLHDKVFKIILQNRKDHGIGL